MQKKFLKRFSDLPPTKRRSQPDWSNDSSLFSISQDSQSSDNYSSSHHNTQDFLSSYSDQRLTDAIDLLENAGYYGDTALFMLAYVGGAV